MSDTDDRPTCTCGDIGKLLRTAIAGRDIGPCDVHRPQRPEAVTSPPALNSDALTSGLGQHVTHL